MPADLAPSPGHIRQYGKRESIATHDGQVAGGPTDGDSHEADASLLAPSADEYRRLADDLRWFLAEQDDVPDRLHARGVWHDSDDGVGSVLGSPALNHAFEAWLERGARSRRTESFEGPCLHGGMSKADLDAGVICQWCVIRDGLGNPIGMSGRIKGEREVYRWPMRAALAKAHHVPAGKGRPRHSVVAAALARSAGDPAAVGSLLAAEYPAMGHPAIAARACIDALRTVRSRYAVAHIPPYRPGSRSEAQLNAEAE